MKSLYSILSVLFLSVFASASFSMPKTSALECPTWKNIKLEGLHNSTEDDGPNDGYTIYNISSYQTPTEWFFFITIPSSQAQNENDAKAEAIKILNTHDEVVPAVLYLDGYKEESLTCIYNENFFNDEIMMMAISSTGICLGDCVDIKTAKKSPLLSIRARLKQ